jgi:hypothetical protein
MSGQNGENGTFAISDRPKPTFTVSSEVKSPAPLPNPKPLIKFHPVCRSLVQRFIKSGESHHARNFGERHGGWPSRLVPGLLIQWLWVRIPVRTDLRLVWEWLLFPVTLLRGDTRCARIDVDWVRRRSYSYILEKHGRSASL